MVIVILYLVHAKPLIFNLVPSTKTTSTTKSNELSILSPTRQIPQWQGLNLTIVWAMDCDFKLDNVLGMKEVSGDLCGPMCKTTVRCTHFSWNENKGKGKPECWLLRNVSVPYTAGEDALYPVPGSVCGYIQTPRTSELFLIFVLIFDFMKCITHFKFGLLN